MPKVWIPGIGVIDVPTEALGSLPQGSKIMDGSGNITQQIRKVDHSFTASSMQVWISARGVEDQILLPVNPPSIGYKDSRNYEDIILANGEERTVTGGKNLKTFSITSFFPANMDAHYVNRQPGVWDSFNSYRYVDKFRAWMEENVVLRLIVTNTNINCLVTLRSFEWTEQGGSVGNIDFTMELKEYKPIAFKNLNEPDNPAPTGGEERPVDSSKDSSNNTYIVAQGDTLWAISKKFYGKGSDYTKIYDANKDLIGPNPNLIKPGQELVIPQ